MTSFPEVSALNRTKNTHSLSLNKLSIPAKQQLPAINHPSDIERSPKPSVIPSKGLHHSPHNERRKSFLDFIGAPSLKDKAFGSPRLKIDPQSPRISLTDFMGNNKYSFLKQTGGIEYYHEYKKTSEVQKILEKKNVFSLPNIVHSDKIRENLIKHPASPKPTEISALFEKQKYGRQEKNEEVDVIQNIIDKCDVLFKESRKLKVGEKEIKEELLVNRLSSRRLTVQDKKLVKRHAD